MDCKKKTTFPTLQVGELSRYKGLSDVSLVEKPSIHAVVRLKSNKAANRSTSVAAKRFGLNKTGYCVSTKNLIALTPDPIDWDALSIQLKANRLCHIPKRKAPDG